MFQTGAGLVGPAASSLCTSFATLVFEIVPAGSPASSPAYLIKAIPVPMLFAILVNGRRRVLKYVLFASVGAYMRGGNRGTVRTSAAGS